MPFRIHKNYGFKTVAPVLLPCLLLVTWLFRYTEAEGKMRFRYLSNVLMAIFYMIVLWIDQNVIQQQDKLNKY